MNGARHGTIEIPPRWPIDHLRMSSLEQDLAAAAFSGQTPAEALVGRLTAAYPDSEGRALPVPAGVPYSRHTLHCSDSLEIMVARWFLGAACATRRFEEK